QPRRNSSSPNTASGDRRSSASATTRYASRKGRSTRCALKGRKRRSSAWIASGPSATRRSQSGSWSRTSARSSSRKASLSAKKNSNLRRSRSRMASSQNSSGGSATPSSAADVVEQVAQRGDRLLHAERAARHAEERERDERGCRDRRHPVDARRHLEGELLEGEALLVRVGLRPGVGRPERARERERLAE